MAIDFSADLPFLLEDAGVVVTLGSKRTHGIPRTDALDLFGGDGAPTKAQRRIVAIKTGSLEGLGFGSRIEVAGTQFDVIDIELADHGMMQHLVLADVV